MPYNWTPITDPFPFAQSGKIWKELTEVIDTRVLAVNKQAPVGPDSWPPHENWKSHLYSPSYPTLIDYITRSISIADNYIPTGATNQWVGSNKVVLWQALLSTAIYKLLRWPLRTASNPAIPPHEDPNGLWAGDFYVVPVNSDGSWPYTGAGSWWGTEPLFKTTQSGPVQVVASKFFEVGIGGPETWGAWIRFLRRICDGLQYFKWVFTPQNNMVLIERINNEIGEPYFSHFFVQVTQPNTGITILTNHLDSQFQPNSPTWPVTPFPPVNNEWPAEHVWPVGNTEDSILSNSDNYFSTPDYNTFPLIDIGDNGFRWKIVNDDIPTSKFVQEKIYGADTVGEAGGLVSSVNKASYEHLRSFTVKQLVNFDNPTNFRLSVTVDSPIYKERTVRASITDCPFGNFMDFVTGKIAVTGETSGASQGLKIKLYTSGSLLSQLRHSLKPTNFVKTFTEDSDFEPFFGFDIENGSNFSNPNSESEKVPNAFACYYYADYEDYSTSEYSFPEESFKVVRVLGRSYDYNCNTMSSDPVPFELQHLSEPWVRYLTCEEQNNFQTAGWYLEEVSEFCDNLFYYLETFDYSGWDLESSLNVVIGSVLERFKGYRRTGSITSADYKERAYMIAKIPEGM